MFSTYSKTLLIINLFSILFIFVKVFGEDEWNYQDQSDWSLHFQSCNGTYESPIDIDSNKLKLNSKLNIKFYNYDEAFYKTTAQNNGHTVRVFIHPNLKNEIPYISGEALNNEKFILDSFHFHWGLNEFNGSEHSINGIKRSAELHLCHWNSNYANLSNAMNMKDGLAVVTVFIETKLITGSGVTHLKTHNRALSPIINVLSQIKQFSSYFRLKVPINLLALIPVQRTVFYKYQGSLTTPPCSPTATFLVFSQPIYMTTEQLSQFHQINGLPVNGQTQPLTQNTRQQMPLNDRVIEVSKVSELRKI